MLRRDGEVFFFGTAIGDPLFFEESGAERLAT